MPEIRNQSPGGAPELESTEIHIPSDADLGSGEYTLRFTARALPAEKVIVSDTLNAPSFQISVTVNPNRNVAALLGKADGSEPLSRKTFVLPPGIVRSLPHTLVVQFADWEITEATLDTVPLMTQPDQPDIQNEGSITFTLTPGPNMPSDWPTDSGQYRFPPFSSHGITLQCTKNEDRTLQAEVQGPLGQPFVFREPLPPETDPQRLPIAITWKHPEVTLYLNGKPVRTLRTL